MVGLKRHASPTSSPPDSPRVAFAPEVVTGISRQPTNTEEWTLYYFERHAARCTHCADPLAVAREGGQLCEMGRELGSDVARVVYRSRDGHVYSRVRDLDERQDVRIEMPAGYFQTERLLRAVQRGIRRGEKFLREKSHGEHHSQKTTHLPVQKPQKKKQHKEKRTSTTDTSDSHHSSSSSSDERRTGKKHTSTRRQPNPNVQIVEPASSRPRQQQTPPTSPQVGTAKRGSLYGFDMGELEHDLKREQALTYNLEVRAPSFGSSGRRYVSLG